MDNQYNNKRKQHRNPVKKFCNLIFHYTMRSHVLAWSGLCYALFCYTSSSAYAKPDGYLTAKQLQADTTVPVVIRPAVADTSIKQKQDTTAKTAPAQDTVKPAPVQDTTKSVQDTTAKTNAADRKSGV